VEFRATVLNPDNTRAIGSALKVACCSFRRGTIHPVSDAPPLPVQPILDYASPGLKRKLALPTTSVLTTHVRDGCVIVTEHLDVKAPAIAAMSFAIFILCWLAFVVWMSHSTAIVIVPVWLFEFALLLRVANDTWRKTILEVLPNRVLLRFSSPFRKRHYEWEAAQVTSVTVFATDFNKQTLGTMNLLLSSTQDVQLFSGHEYDQLFWLGNEIRSVLAVTPPPKNA
jgi:hypothetical protein